MTNTFGTIIVKFFRKHLINEKGCSSNTINSYSDCIRLLILYCCKNLNVNADQLNLEDIDKNIILNFLDFIEKERCALPSTRNQRLAAIKTFFRFLALEEPEMLVVCERVCDIKIKKTEHKVVTSMNLEEVTAILNSPGNDSNSDIRDKTILMLLHNTGARVQEIVDIDIINLDLGVAPQVLLTGKGKKQRIIPLWDKTVDLLLLYLNVRQADSEEKALFLNAKSKRIGRFGIDYIIKKHKKNAEKECPTLAKIKISPHVFRHTTALFLIQSGADIVTVKEWLGHVDIKTTCMYLEINIEMKRVALAKCPAPTTDKAEMSPQWQQPEILDFLENLSKSSALC